jgi:hypothetical protein
MKIVISTLSAFITFLAASCCLDTFRILSSSTQTNITGHGIGVEGAAMLGSAGSVMKEAFISNLVANMTVPELGETNYLYIKQRPDISKA